MRYTLCAKVLKGLAIAHDVKLTESVDGTIDILSKFYVMFLELYLEDIVPVFLEYLLGDPYSHENSVKTCHSILNKVMPQ